MILRNKGLFVGLIAAAALAAQACGDSTNGAAPGSSGGPSTSGQIDLDGGPGNVGPHSLPCDVDTILENNCRKCHSSSPQYGAPMPLVTWDNLHARAHSDESKSVFELIPGRIANDADPMPPSPNGRLVQTDRDVLSQWVAAGAPKGPETCGGVPTDQDGGPLTSCTPDLTIQPQAPYDMPASAGDQYVCWGVDLVKPTPTHITAFAPKIDNTNIVHHVVLYEAPSSVSPTPTVCEAGGSIQWRMVFGWAPGAKGLELPPEAGFPIATTGATHYVMQLHYSNPQKVGGKDNSGMSFCTSPPRQYEADVIAFGTQKISVQPGQTLTKDCTVPILKQFTGIKMFAAMPHMHQIGTAIKTQLEPAGGGGPISLGDDPAFNFKNQSWVAFNATTAKDDVIRTQCTYKNTTSDVVTFGEKTANEMCYSFTMYYPRIKATAWSWATPALGSTCTDK